MQQGHPRRKQLDRAKHEIKMHNRRRTKEDIDVVIDAYRAIGQTVKEAAKQISQMFKKWHSGATVETKIDSGLTSIKM